jgi:hypothetical protein
MFDAFYMSSTACMTCKMLSAALVDVGLTHNAPQLSFSER